MQAHALEQRLREKIRELLAAIRSVSEEKGPLVRDFLDAALLEQDVEPFVSTLRTQEIYEIDQAIARINAGTYGWCSECGGEIGAKRLTAVPWARLCLPCKEAEEREMLSGPARLGRRRTAARH